MKYIYISIILFSITLFSFEQNNIKNDYKWFNNISISIQNILFQLNISNDSSCFKSIVNKLNIAYFNSDIDIISNPINEIVCNSSSFLHYLLVYEFTKDAFFDDNIKKKILQFSSYENKFSTGICIPKECKDDIENNIFYNGKLKNSKLKQILKNIIKIDKFFYLKQESKKEDSKSQIIKYCFYIYILFRVIISIIGECIYGKKNKQNMNEKINKINENNEQIISNYTTINKVIFVDKNESEINLEQNNSCLFYFNLWENFNIYNSNKKSKWYNDEKLEVINLFKALILFFCVLDYHIYSLLKNPTKDFFDKSFYENILFILIKFAQFSKVSYISLDSFILSYKFYSFYKHYCIDQKEKISIIYKFILMSIPKIILYYINFFVLHYYLYDIVNSFNLFNWQKFYFDNKNRRTECSKKLFPDYIINYLSFSFTKYSPRFDDCHVTFFVYHNEFYMLIIFILLFYFLMKTKSNKFDLIIILIIYIPYTFYFLFFKDSISDNYDRSIFYGELYTIKSFYLFIGLYFIGILTGIAFFHYNDSISSSYISNDYIPFYFTSYITKFLYESSTLFKSLIIFICLLMLIFLSSSYFIFSRYYSDITFQLNNILIFLFFYEKILFLIFFNILLLMILITDENNGGLFTKIGKVSFIRLISRNSLTFFASYDSLIKIFYLIFDYQFCLGYSDSFFTALGEYSFILLFSCFFGILFELPFRMLIIKLKHPDSEIDLNFYLSI